MQELDKTQKYIALVKQIEGLISRESDAIANMANVAAAITNTFRFWWVGFYRVVGLELILGPFQGPLACTRIGYGKGVCGAAWHDDRTIVVPDVEKFPGHIACSSESRSEIVVPIHAHGHVAAVLDIDSATLDSFDSVDAEYLQQIAEMLSPSISESFGMEERTIYLAGGCFWGTEHFLGLIEGVEDTQVGYANSTIPNPTYKEVCSGATHAAETVRVVYDPKKVNLERILKLYFMTINPLSVNRQGNDIGTQYRTGIYYTDTHDLPVIEKAVAELAEKFSSPLAIEIMPLENFYPAEDYHQDYLYKNPNGYCHISPQLFALAKNS